MEETSGHTNKGRVFTKNPIRSHKITIMFDPTGEPSGVTCALAEKSNGVSKGLTSKD